MQTTPTTPNPNEPPIRTGSFVRRHGAATALSLLLVGAAAYGVDAWRDNAGLHDSNDTLERQLGNVTSLNKGANARIDDLEGQLRTVDEREAALQEREDAVAEQEGAIAEQETAVAEREKAVAAVEEAIEANQVSDGTWTVGSDVQPGTYRTTDVVSSDCYWEITAGGSNGSDIIENDIPGGGYPVVTVQDGQVFTSARCGTWAKQ